MVWELPRGGFQGVPTAPAPMKRIDLNADLGEGGVSDAQMLAFASSANIACGGHAGDEETMRLTIGTALAAGVSIGAHPGYEDREFFGRRPLDLPVTAVRDLMFRQLERFGTVSGGLGAPVRHVKPHGALYNQADRSAELAAVVIDAIREVFPDSRVVGPPGGCLAGACREAGVSFLAEGFSDRRYGPDGALVARSEAGAVLDDPAEAVGQALEIAVRNRVRAADGSWVSMAVDTLCVHGDGPGAPALLGRLRRALEESGFRIGSD